MPFGVYSVSQRGRADPTDRYRLSSKRRGGVRILSSLRSLLQLPEDSGRSYPKVLVVEDDEVNAMILKQVLEESPRLRSLARRRRSSTPQQLPLSAISRSNARSVLDPCAGFSSSLGNVAVAVCRAE